MKTIVVATDFSPASVNATHYAVELAKVIGAEIILFHAYQIPVSYSEVPVAFNLDDLRHDAEKHIGQALQQLKEYAGGKVTISSECRIGDFYSELKDLCDEVKPYTVVIGAQGKTAAARFLFGSHTVNAMKHLPWPLIAVPASAKFGSIKKIGLACDLEKVVETIPDKELKMLVGDFNAELHVLHTGAYKEFSPETVFESGLLQEMIGNLNPKYHFIKADDVDEGILDFTEKNNIDLLIVLPRRHKLIEMLTHRSHTKKLVLHSEVPVMALHQEQ